MASGPQDALRCDRRDVSRLVDGGHLSPPPPHAARDAGQAAPAGSLLLPRRFPASDHDLTVIVPAYNEAARLPATLDGLGEFLGRWGVDYRVLVVDDGSSDRTARLTDDRGPRFACVSQPNRGKGAAVRNGMLRATGRVVAFTDADLPYRLDGLRLAYDLVRDGRCDVVFGARDLRESTALARRRLARTLATEAFRGIVRRLVSREVSDTQCGLKAFSRRAALEIFTRTQVDGFAFDAEVVFLADRLRLAHRRIPVTLINEYASTISLTRHALPMLADVVHVRLRARRGEYALDGAERVVIEPATEPVRNAA